MSNNKVIIENRKFINKLLQSEASFFCFFRRCGESCNYTYGSEYSLFEVKYDTLEILINRKQHYRAKSIEFRLRTSESEAILKTYEFCEIPQDEELWSNIIQEVRREYYNDMDILDRTNEFYYSKKPEIYNGLGILNEEDIAQFIELNSFDLKNYYKFYTKEDFIQNNFSKEILEKRRFCEPYPNIFEMKVVYKYGLILKERFFHQKHSDFGWDNYYSIVMSDRAYFHNSKSEIFSKLITPRDEEPPHLEFWNKIYAYYFNDKKMILVNYDNMITGPLKKIGYSLHEIPCKLFEVPDQLQEDSYIITVNNELYSKKLT